MSFWTTETFRSRLHAEAIVTPADESRLKQGCYRFRLDEKLALPINTTKTQKTILESADNTAIIPLGNLLC